MGIIKGEQRAGYGASGFSPGTGTALASGYRIPEQSVNSTARAGGYVAHTPAADASYFNPANMDWLDSKAQ
ncbi:MAG: hypothetical protein EOM10_12190, partial [Opitutae bacterium]|nr:hypothetical protein [Opitutae bacterium]